MKRHLKKTCIFILLLLLIATLCYMHFYRENTMKEQGFEVRVSPYLLNFDMML